MNCPKMTADQSLGLARGTYICQEPTEEKAMQGITGMMQNLPTEMMWQVLALLNPQELLDLRGANHRFRQVVDNYIQENEQGDCTDLGGMFPLEHGQMGYHNCCQLNPGNMSWKSANTHITYQC